LDGLGRPSSAIDTSQVENADPMMRLMKLLGGSLLLVCAGLSCGCEPQKPSEQELGRIVFSESEVPGADRSYELPKPLQKTHTDEDKKGPPGR
jgi:hypothetical protein